MHVYRKCSTRGCVKRLIQHEAKPRAVLILRHSQVLCFLHTSIGFKCYIVLPGCLAQSDPKSFQFLVIHRLSVKYSYNQYLVIEQTSKIILISFSDLHYHAHDRS